ncbi:MAG: efflux RND transporter permease subunit [Candidatus Fermentibacteraceae bacterium]|nr:efflux RND transporter permease subunit [Candidatus Fermentibacteraceae bacterium]MBN2609425.1 efflux RND transporter permease subunit [Candidatus Fermentibacteraceae bacterium]
MNLPGFAVRRKVTFLMVFLIMAGAGLFALTRLGIDYFPKVDLGQIAIVTVLPGAGPSEVEGLVTELLEDAVSGVEGIETVISTSRNGVSMITLELKNSADIDQAEVDIRDAVDRVKAQLPDGAGDPVIMAMESSMKPLILLTFTSDIMSGTQLRNLVDEEIAPRLGRVEGISSVDIVGGQVRQINVEVDPALLGERGISLFQVYTALAAVGGDQPGGDIRDGDLELALSVKSGFDDLESIRELVIGAHEGRPVSLGEVAAVVDGHEEQTSLTHLNQGDAVLLIFRKTADANTVNTCGRLEDEITDLAEEYSGVLSTEIIYNQERFITGSMKDLGITAVQAVLLAAAVLTFFLGSLSNAGIVSLSMPLSFVASFAAMFLLGIDLNIMSLAGLSISVGMIVDNSVVVIENIHRWRREGSDRLRAAEGGAAQVGMAVTASTLTTVAVFIPMLFVPGITGQIFRDLSLTISSALFISLFVSQSLIPLLSSRSGKLVRQHPPKSATGRIQGWLDRLEEKYSRVVRRLTSHSRYVFIPVLLLFVGSLLLLGMIPKTYLPEPKEGVIEIDISLAPGTGLSFTDSVMVDVENRVLRVIEPGDLAHSYMDVGKREGLGALFGSSSSSSGEISLYFVEEHRRIRSIEYYEEVIREVLDLAPGIDYSLTSGIPIGNEYPVSVVIYGTDLEQLRNMGEMVKQEMGRIPGTVDVTSSMENRLMQVDFVPDESVLFLRGMSPARIGMELTIGVLGLDASTYSEESREYDVNLRYASEFRSSREAVAGLTAYGMPLDAWGSFRSVLVPEKIDRRDRTRTVEVDCRISGRALGDVASDVEAMMDTLSLNGHRWEILGDVKDRGEAFISMGLAIVVSLILVYMVMASQFESLLEPFIIIVEVPLALIGVIWTLLLTGTTMGLTALVGLLMLGGIVVNNGIVFIDYANQLRRQHGMSSVDAVVEAGRKRMRPILMTAITTILALMPLAAGATESSVLWAPMARTVAGGLAVATALTLIVLPCLYVRLDRWKKR